MIDLQAFIDVAADIICMMLPSAAVEAIGIVRDDAILISLAAIGFLMFSIMASASKEMFPTSPTTGVIVAACMLVLVLMGLGRETMKGIFITCYPPMILAMRFAEGFVAGWNVGPHLRWWHPLVCFGSIAAVYGVLQSIPNKELTIAISAWAVIGVVLAAWGWTRIMADTPMFGNPIAVVAVFVVFLSTLAYVSASPMELVLYQWLLPSGIVVGLVKGRIRKERRSSTASQ